MTVTLPVVELDHTRTQARAYVWRNTDDHRHLYVVIYGPTQARSVWWITTKNRYIDNNGNDNEKDDNDKIYIVIRTIKSIMKEIKEPNNDIDNYNDDKDTSMMTITTRQW